MEDLINKFANKFSANTIELQEDEYIKDDLIYCKNCNTPRSCYVFGNRLVRCMCKCTKEARKAEQQRQIEINRLNEVKKLKKASLMGERYHGASFGKTEIGYNNSFDQAFIRCKRYCEASHEVYNEGMGIYLFGDTGTGKTHITACMANELMNQRYQVLFTNFFEISKIIRSTFGKSSVSESDYINQLANIDFLFIDDLGTERVQSNENDLWLQEKIFDVLNKRYNSKKPTIFTSNNSLQELISERGFMQKTVDRIAEMSTAILKIEGASYRLKIREKANIPF